MLRWITRPRSRCRSRTTSPSPYNTTRMSEPTPTPDSPEPPTPPGNEKTAPSKKKKKRHINPEEYRMSIGDHLEELRNRLFLGVAGFFVACVICFIFGEHVTRWFIKPFIDACDANDINP